jgi:hypothetical protein
LFFLSFLAAPSSRADMGLPEDWNVIESWLSGGNFNFPNTGAPEPVQHLKKNTGTTDFSWETFPRRGIPAKPETRINIELLREKVEKNKEKLLEQEVRRAYRAIDYLENGAPAHQLNRLRSCLVGNKVPSAEANEAVLNTVSDWIKEGFVAGPFRQPPLDDFRVNGMIAIVKGKKVRPVLNVSEPSGKSFNDNVDKYMVEKSSWTQQDLSATRFWKPERTRESIRQT